MVYTFFDEVKTRQVASLQNSGIPGCRCVRGRKEVSVASCFLSLKDPGYDPEVWWLSSSPGAGWGCGGGAGFKCVLLCLPIMMQIKILK